MSDADRLRSVFTSVAVSADGAQAVVGLSDGSGLVFSHRVGERTVQASTETGEAATVLARIALFRLNRKHLDIRFADGSRWEILLGR